MENIQLEGRIIEPHYGRNIGTAPALLARYDKGEGVILSEADIRLLGVRNFKNAPELANNYWDTSTLSATKGETVKVILPYETGSRILTEPARFGLGLINSDEDLVNYGANYWANYGANLDIDGRWEKYCKWNEGDGVYTRQRNEWFEKINGVFVGLNRDMIEKQVEKCPILLTKLGHPDYVDSKFARPKDEISEIIGKTFELLDQEYDYATGIGQSLPKVSDKGVLKAWCVCGPDYWARSNARSWLDVSGGRFAFDSVGK